MGKANLVVEVGQSVFVWIIYLASWKWNKKKNGVLFKGKQLRVVSSVNGSNSSNEISIID